MSIPSQVSRWLDAWNGGDAAQVGALLAHGGHYRECGWGGLDRPSSLEEAAGRWRLTFPDLRWELLSVDTFAEGAWLRWRITGTQSGSPATHFPASQARLDLHGCDYLQWHAEQLTVVERTFDAVELHRQLGLMTLVQPHQSGPALFGYSMRVSSGNPSIPGLIALTWIAAKDPDEKGRIIHHSRRIVQDFLAEPGFIGIVTGFAGLRGFTVTAWENEDALQRALGKHHTMAAAELRQGPISPGVWTSLWEPLRINRVWTRCVACQHLNDVSKDERHCAACGAELPPRPPVW